MVRAITLEAMVIYVAVIVKGLKTGFGLSGNGIFVYFVSVMVFLAA